MNCYRFLLVLVALLVSGVSLTAQEDSLEVRTVSGVVYDSSSGLPMAFASVNCGDFSSTFTDMEGLFELDVPGKTSVITVDLVGYHLKDVLVSGRDSIIVYLKEASSFSFQEEVSTGYFDVKQVYTTQSVAGVGQIEDKRLVMSSSSESVFDGRVAGINVLQRNGIKGSGSDLFLRGFSSLYLSNQPLIVVDGMIYDYNSYGTSLLPGFRSNALAGIDVNDIESVSVIRDAASIYGAKAANGVILIETSHAKKQATTIDLTVSGGMEQMPDALPLLGADQYRLFANEMLLSSGLSLDSVARFPFLMDDLSSAGYYTYRNSTDWQKEVFKNSYSSNYGLAIKGGDDVALYALTVGYMKQGGTVEESDFSRFNMRFNSDINISPRLTLNSNIGFYYTERDITGSGLEGISDPVHQARIKAPFLNAFRQNESGAVSPEYSDYDIFGVSNPVSLISGMEQNHLNYRLSGSFNFNVKVNEYFRVENRVGVVFDKSRENVFIPGEGVRPDSIANGVIENVMKSRVLRQMFINNDLRAVYNKKIGDEHHLQSVVGVRLNVSNVEEDWGADFNSANDQIHTLGSGNFLLRDKGGFLGEWSNLTGYVDANYDFRKRYFLSVSMSLDGNSRFGVEADGTVLFNTVFGFFPAVSGAWLLSSEPFMAGVNWVDLIKLRAGYGLTGNDDIGNYTAKKYYSTINFLGYQGTRLGTLWNPELGWEKNSKLNLGVDLAVARERIGLSLDFYQNQTTNLFDYINTDVYSGFRGYYGNHGSLTTKGVDFSINGRVINKPFKWDLGAVLSHYKTTMDEMWGNERTTTFYGATFLTREDSPIAQFYGYKTNGVFATDASAASAALNNRQENGDLVPFSAGDVVFVERTVDGIIDENDMQVIGDPNPDVFGEFFSSMKYKNLSLFASVNFSYGGEVFNYMRYSLERMSSLDNQTLAIVNRWQHEGDQTSIPRAQMGDPMGNSRFSDRWIEDGSYVRLKTVTLSYEIPIRTTLFRKAEAYITGVNLLTLTNYKGLDPEFSAGGSALEQGVDLGMIPQNRTFLVGIKIGL